MVYYQDGKLTIRSMEAGDPQVIYDTYMTYGWHPQIEYYQNYMKEEQLGERLTFIAVWEGAVVGLCTLVLHPKEGPWAGGDYPEIVDLAVFYHVHNLGIGNKLLDVAETEAAKRADMVFLAVGVHSGYGPAQRIYAKRGYIPDGSGVWYQGKVLDQYAPCVNDDDLLLFLSKNVSELQVRPATGTVPSDTYSDTLDWYRDHAEAFIANTQEADISSLYEAFMEHLPENARVLDLGCGAGNASLYFANAGYSVLAVDGCREFCDYTHDRVGCPVRCIRFDELDYEAEFDGVWACASLLHVSKNELPGILRRISRALKPGGIFYASFKYGDGERSRDGRAFSDFTEESLRELLDATGGFAVTSLGMTQDVRPGRADERWVNVFCVKECVNRCRSSTCNKDGSD